MICVVKLCYAPRQTHILMTCTCNCSMHIQHNVMQLFHANSAPACTRSRSPHNVLHSPSIIGASLSEPHIDEFAVNFPYISIYLSIVRRAVNHFLLVFCVSLHHALIQTTNELTIATSTTETRTMNGLPQQGWRL